MIHRLYILLLACIYLQATPDQQMLSSGAENTPRISSESEYVQCNHCYDDTDVRHYFSELSTQDMLAVLGTIKFQNWYLEEDFIGKTEDEEVDTIEEAIDIIEEIVENKLSNCHPSVCPCSVEVLKYVLPYTNYKVVYEKLAASTDSTLVEKNETLFKYVLIPELYMKKAYAKIFAKATYNSGIFFITPDFIMDTSECIRHLAEKIVNLYSLETSTQYLLFMSSSAQIKHLSSYIKDAFSEMDLEENNELYRYLYNIAHDQCSTQGTVEQKKVLELFLKLDA